MASSCSYRDPYKTAVKLITQVHSMRRICLPLDIRLRMLKLEKNVLNTMEFFEAQAKLKDLTLETEKPKTVFKSKYKLIRAKTTKNKAKTTTVIKPATNVNWFESDAKNNQKK